MKRRNLSAALVGVVACAGFASASAGVSMTAGGLPSGAKLTGQVRVPAGFGGIAAGEGAVWVKNEDQGRLRRIDPKTMSVAATIRVRAEDGDVATGDGAVWVVNGVAGTVLRIDPATNKVVATIRVGLRPDGIAVAQGAVWVANRTAPSVSRIDPATNSVVATISVGPKSACCNEHMSVTGGGEFVWAGVANRNALVRIDPATNTVTATLKTPFPPCAGLAADESTVWSAGGFCANVVGRIDAQQLKLTRTVTQELHPVNVHLGFGSAWVSALDRKTLDRLDPATGRVIGRLRIGGWPARFEIGLGFIWMHDDKGRVLRITPHPRT